MYRSYQKEKRLTIKIPIRFVTFLKGSCKKPDFCNFPRFFCKFRAQKQKFRNNIELFQNDSHLIIVYTVLEEILFCCLPGFGFAFQILRQTVRFCFRFTVFLHAFDRKYDKRGQKFDGSAARRFVMMAVSEAVCLIHLVF